MQTTLNPSLLMAILTLCHLTQGSINKCCPHDQIFKYNDGDFECVPTDDADVGVEEDWWRMPEEGLLLANGSGDNSWLADVRVVDGRRPQCASGSRDVLLLSAAEKDFNLVLQGDDVVLQVLKESARHDPGVGSQTNYPPADFCVDQASYLFVAMLCPCRAVPCVRKCCWDSEAYNQTSHACQHVEDFPYQVYDWVPGIYNDTKEKFEYYRLTQKAPDCVLKATHVIHHRLDEEAKLILLPDGGIQAADTGRIYSADRYCGDFTVDNDEMINYCLDSEVSPPSDIVLHVYGALFLLSSAALIVTVVLTLLFQHMRSSLFTLMALMHNVMLLIGFTTTGLAQLGGHNLANSTCSYISFTIQFSIIASFFWLNAMCFDISWVFSGLHQIRGGNRQSSCRQQFISYSLYAWGSTGLISLVTIIAEYSPGLSTWRPNFGEEMCFFNNRKATWLFFYGPMAALVSVNLSLLALTAWRMWTSHRRHAILDAEENARVTHRNKLVLFLKLFTLLGASWIFEVLSWAVDGHSAFWIFTDVINLLRGVFIFVVFCCNKAVCDSVRERVGQLRWWCRGSETGGYRKTTSNRLELDELVSEEQ